MLSRTLLSRVAFAVRHGVQLQSSRAISLTPAVMQQTEGADPIQQLFLQKIREYASKQKQSPDGFVEASQATKDRLKEELERLAKTYSVTEANKDSLPTFNFQDQSLGAVDTEKDDDIFEEPAAVAAQKEAETKTLSSTPFFEVGYKEPFE